MKIRNRRILALLSTTSFVVVAGMMNVHADETTDKQTYLDGTNRVLVGGYALPDDVAGVSRVAVLVGGTGATAVFDVETTISPATNTAGVVSGPYEAPFVNSSVTEVPYLDGVADVRDVTIRMEGGSVGQLWGSYQYSDVPSGMIMHNISGGEVGRLYGGANLNNSTNAQTGYTPAQVQGIVINMSGGNVGQIRAGNSSGEGGADSAQNVGAGGVTVNISGGVVGQEGQQDAIRGGGGAYNGVDGKVMLNISGDAAVIGDVYAGGRDSTVGSTEINISGGSIEGNVYGGGTYDSAAATVTNDTQVNISGGSIEGDVYAAGKNDTVGGNTRIVMTGDSAVVSGTLHGGADNSAAPTPGSVGGAKSIDLGTADAAYSGAVRLADFNAVNVNNGTTSIESMSNAVEGTAVTVAQSATLNTRAGVLADLERLDVQGGTLNVDMAGSNDSAISGKSLTLAGGSTINVTNAADDSQSIFVLGFDAVDSADDVSLTLNGKPVSASMWNMTNGILIIQELNAGNLSLSPNQSRFYNTLVAMDADGAAAPEISELVASRDESAVKARLDALSGHEYATAMSSQIDGNMGHLRRLRAAMGKGIPLQMGSTQVETMVDGKSGEVMETTTITNPRRWRVGVQGFYDESDIDSDSHGDGYDRSEAGAMLTAEYLVRSGLVMGGALSYGRTSLRTDHARTRHEDNTRFDVYSLCRDGRWTFATSVGMGLHTHHMRRHTRRKSDVDGYAINFMHETAYALMQTESASVQMYGGVESSWNKMDSMRESGGDYKLRLHSRTAWATDVNMGLRFNMEIPSLGSAPAGIFSIQTGAVGSVGAVNPAAKLSLDGYKYRQNCARRDRWGWEIGAGLDVPVTERVSLFGTAEAIIRSDSHSLDGQVGVKVAF